MAQTAARSVDAPVPGDGYVQSFARGLGVIRSFSADAPEQTLSSVAERSGLTRAGARRILLTLQTLGYVESDGKLFRLTPRILELGMAYLSSMPLWHLAGPVMERLSEQLGESCSAAVLDGTDIVYVMRVHTHQILSVNLGVGSRLPAFCTSMGRVLLAGLDDGSVRERLNASERQPRTRHTLTDVPALMTEVHKARRQGWALVDQELEDGLISMAVAVRDASGRAVAALNVSGHASRHSATQMRRLMLPALQAAAMDISQLLQGQVRRGDGR